MSYNKIKTFIIRFTDFAFQTFPIVEGYSILLFYFYIRIDPSLQTFDV